MGNDLIIAPETSYAYELPGNPVKMQLLILWAWKGAWDSAFLIGLQVIPLLLASGTFFEEQGFSRPASPPSTLESTFMQILKFALPRVCHFICLRVYLSL